MSRKRPAPLPLWLRLPVEDRAGSRIDHAFSESIFANVKQGVKLHGLLDHRQRVYQCGGELSNFVLWKLRVVSLPLEVWNRVKGRADYIEVIDHLVNRCYRISAADFEREMRLYDEGIGRRVGAPLELWSVSEGRIAPARPTPAPSASSPTLPRQASLL